MTVVTRFVLKNIAQTILGLILVPATYVWGQASQTPPSPSAMTASQDATPPSGASQQSAEKPEVADAGSGFSFLKVVGGLGLVLSLIVLGTFGIKKIAPQYFAKKTSDRTLRLVETLPMGERRSLVVIEFEERRLLIGSTPNQITLLANLDGSSASASGEELPSPLSTPQASASSFRNMYEVEKGGLNGGSKIKIIPPDVRAKMRQLRESLER